MKTMKWLLRREFWENKGSILWAPIVVGAVMVLFVAMSAFYGATGGRMDNHTTVTVDGHSTTTSSSFNGGIPPEARVEVAEMVAGAYVASAAPLYIMLFVVVFFYCLSALHDERSDRSILFWKSLPISDGQTVLSKVIVAALVAPLITIAVGTFVSLLLMLIMGIALASHDVNMFGLVLSNPKFYLAPLQLLGMLPVYILFALPTIGWLLMVSAWAKSRVFLWAVGTPAISIIIVKWVNFMLGAGVNLDWFINNVIIRVLIGLCPGSWFLIEKIDMGQLVQRHDSTFEVALHQSWMTLGSPSVWFGAVAGCAMIFMAMRLRRWKDEG